MEDLKKKVLESFEWKKNNSYCAKRIGISVSKYTKIKKQLKTGANPKFTSKVDLDKGSATYSIDCATEPKTPEEIVKLLKIDTTKWKLSNYWNKQIHNGWRVSALVTQIKHSEEKLFEELLKKWKPKKYKIPKLYRPKGFEIAPHKDAVCGVMSLQDIHFGKEGNETIDKDFEDTIKYLIKKAIVAHTIEKLYFVVGGDLINMDTFNGTTTSGTPVDNCMTATEAYIQAFDAMHWAINTLKHYCESLVIVYVPGNHDRLSSFHLVHALSKSIDDPDIEWDIKYEERKVHVWHNNFNAFEHGDAMSKHTPIIYATEFAIQWGGSKYRTLFTGHFHQNKKIEYITTSETAGFIHKTLPSLSETDYYHYHNKYTGNRRSGKLELQCPNKGTVCELTYTAD
jgi:hypothetical protein